MNTTQPSSILKTLFHGTVLKSYPEFIQIVPWLETLELRYQGKTISLLLLLHWLHCIKYTSYQTTESDDQYSFFLFLLTYEGMALATGCLFDECKGHRFVNAKVVQVKGNALFT